MRSLMMRLLLALLGMALVLWSAETLLLGVVGERTHATITHIRRQGGERSDPVPGRYAYSLSYTFTLPDGTRVDGFTTKIGSAVYVKAGGTFTRPVRYLRQLPWLNALEEDTRPSVGHLVLMAAGGLLLCDAWAGKRPARRRLPRKAQYR